MNKNILIPILLLIVFTARAQDAPPQGITYQAVALDDKGKEIVGVDASGMPLAEKQIKVRFTIIRDFPAGPVEYSEEHLTSTDRYGLFTLIIGQGIPKSVTLFNEIDWSSGAKYLKVELDYPNTGQYKLSSLQKMWSVPYALYATNTSNVAWKLLGNEGTNPDSNFVGTTDTVDLVFRTDSLEQVRITTGGDVGIGTSKPAAKVEVRSDTNEFRTALRLHNNDPGISSATALTIGNDTNFIFQFGKLGLNTTDWPGHGQPGENFIYNGTYARGLNVIVPDQYTGKMGFFVGTDATQTPKMHITNYGRIGVGTVDPQGNVDIVADTNYFDVSLRMCNLNQGDFSAAAIVIGEDTSMSMQIGRLGHAAAAWPAYGKPGESFIYNGGHARGLNVVLPDTNQAKINFYVGTNASGTPTFNISSSGRVGVGTENPAAKFTVEGGDVYVTDIGSGVIMKSPSGQCWRISVSDTGALGATAIVCP